MNPRPFLACIAIVAGTALAPAASAAPNQLTAAEKSAGWTLLFDGKTTNGWRVYNKKGTAINGWTVVDGTLHCQSKVKGDNIITEKQFNDFELAWEWKLLPKGNNGVKYFVTEARPKSPGPEYQMIDDAGHKDAQRGAYYQAGALYSMIPATQPAAKPVGQYNLARVVVKGNHIQHFLNGVKVAEGELNAPSTLEKSAGRWTTESLIHKALAEQPKKLCPIALQNHGDAAWFRSIKIRKLP